MTDNQPLENTALSGMTAIREFCRSINLASSESSVINMIVTCDFPARKIGGIWESDKVMIVEWRRRFISDGASLQKTDEKKSKRKNAKIRRW
jgi:hypothetical protein